MAKVKQARIRLELDPAHFWKETVIDICYDATDRRTQTFRRPIPSEDQRFYIKLPKVVADALGIDKAFGKDQVIVMENFESLIRQFKTLKTKVNRVILYEFDVEPDPRDTHYGFGGRYSVRIWAGTFKETVLTDGAGNKRYSYELIESSINFHKEHDSTPVSRWGDNSRQFVKQVVWTKRNEAFFLWLKDNMQLLIDKLIELDEPNKLIESINAGRLLPLGSSEIR